MPDTLPAVVLAAGSMSPELAEMTGVGARALIPVGGRAMVDAVLEALDGAACVGDVRVVCAEGSPLLEHVGTRGVTTQGPAFLDSVRTGLNALGRPEQVLLVTGDLPFLTAEAVDHFCAEALQSGAGIVYSIVGRDDCERMFPSGRRLYVRLADGRFTGGNLGVVSREFVETQGERLASAFAGRKKPLRLAALFGWRLVWRLVIGRLTLQDVVRRGETLLGTSLHVVQSPYPEVGFDVDKPSNLETATRWHSGRPAASA